MSGVDRGALDDLVAGTDNAGEVDQPEPSQRPDDQPEATR